MKLLILIGNSSVGKMTVGQELAKITPLRLFHNHMMIEPVLEVFGQFRSDVIQKLRRIVFPGYFRERNYRSYHAENHLSALMEDVIYHLSTQITRALQGCDQEQVRRQAMEITLDFFG